MVIKEYSGKTEIAEKNTELDLEPPKKQKKYNRWKNTLKLLRLLGLLGIYSFTSALVSTALAIDNVEEIDSPSGSSKITISIHSGSSWIGVNTNNILSICKINREKMKIEAFKQITLEPKEIEILRRFILIKGVLKYQKENQTLGEQQAELVKETMPEASETLERIKKTTHIKLWINDQLRQVVLINDPRAKEIWPEDLKYLLKLLSNTSKKAEAIKIEGAGFTQSLEHYKDPKTKWKDWAQLHSKKEEFHTINDTELRQCPENLQQMISFPNFVVPLKETDLKLMTDLNWTERPEDSENPENLESLEKNSTINQITKKEESPYDILWGIVSYKNKTFGINAWQSENPESVISYDNSSESEPQ